MTTLAVRDTKGEVRVVYEHFDALPLRSLIADARTRGRRFPLPVALRIASDILAALSDVEKVAEQAPDIPSFGGLTPDTVLVSAASGQSKLCDAVVASCAALMEELSSHPDKLGYTAPEQIHPVAPPTVQCDIFATGAILWELLAGRRLLSGTRETIERRLLEHDFPRLAASVGDKRGPSPQLAALVESMLAADASLRPRTARELQQRLSECGHSVATPREVAEFLKALSVAKRGGSEKVAASASRPIQTNASKKPKARGTQAGRVPMPSVPRAAAKRAPSIPGAPRPRMATIGMGMSPLPRPESAQAPAKAAPSEPPAPSVREQLEAAAEQVSRAKTQPPPSPADKAREAQGPAPFFPPSDPPEEEEEKATAAEPAPAQAAPAEAPPAEAAQLEPEGMESPAADPAPAEKQPETTARAEASASRDESELSGSDAPGKGAAGVEAVVEQTSTEEQGTAETDASAAAMAEPGPKPPLKTKPESEAPAKADAEEKAQANRENEPAALVTPKEPKKPRTSAAALTAPESASLPSERHSFSVAPAAAPPATASHWPRRAVLGLGGLTVAACAMLAFRTYFGITPGIDAESELAVLPPVAETQPARALEAAPTAPASAPSRALEPPPFPTPPNTGGDGAALNAKPADDAAPNAEPSSEVAVEEPEGADLQGPTENTDVENTDVENTDVENTDVENTDVENTDVENTDVENTGSEVVGSEEGADEAATQEATSDGVDREAREAAALDGPAPTSAEMLPGTTPRGAAQETVTESLTAADLLETFQQPKLSDDDIARAFSLETRGTVDTCEATAGSEAAKDPAQAKALLRTARRALIRGESEDARSKLCQALEADPDHAGARRTLTELALHLGDPARAQQIAQAGLDRNPNDAELWGWLSEALALQGQLEESRKALLKADSRPGPESVRTKALTRAYGKAGLKAYQGGGYARARSYYRRAIVLGQGGVYHSMRLAEALLWLGETQAAMVWSQRAASAMTKSWRAQMVLGDALDKLGNRDAARKAWKAAKRLNPGSRLVRKRLRKK